MKTTTTETRPMTLQNTMARRKNGKVLVGRSSMIAKRQNPRHQHNQSHNLVQVWFLSNWCPTSSYIQWSGAYIPPHLRNLQTDPNSEALLKLTRQLKGLLNRYVFILLYISPPSNLYSLPVCLKYDRAKHCIYHRRHRRGLQGTS